ncbi:histidine kinase dimerization/phosphoacceptor domain -containing protein [Parvibaculum sp.]|uniref:sensor histidine kinase n=1 Tax=Parvibaculum sp. TaxID=2024848 RepID=UPI003210E8C7
MVYKERDESLWLTRRIKSLRARLIFILCLALLPLVGLALADIWLGHLHQRGQQPQSVEISELLFGNAVLALVMWLAAALAAGWGAGRLVTRPLRRIRRGIIAFSEGDERARIRHIAELPEEIRLLAESFNRMADALAARDAALLKAVARQKALTREVHHRVHNNLQIVNSLMNLQSRKAETSAESTIFDEVQRRVTALGLVHGAIYQGDDLNSVKLDLLLNDLCASMEQSLRNARMPASIFVTADKLIASANLAVPLAFLITEIIGEIAFPREGSPTATDVRIALRGSGSGAVLTVETTRPLLPEPSDTGGSHGLIDGLVRQLGGRYTISPDRNRISVSVPNLDMAGR